MSERNSNRTDAVVRPANLRNVTTESIDIFSLFSRQSSADLARNLIDKTFVHSKPQLMESVVLLRGRKLWGKLHLRTLRMGPSRLVLVLIEDLTLERRQRVLDHKHELELRKARDNLELRV